MAPVPSLWSRIGKSLRPGRRPAEPHRDTISWPNLVSVGQTRPGDRVLWKPTPRNLRYFSRTVYARRAINAIKNPIALLEWEIRVISGVTETSEHRRQIEIARQCLEFPNRDDDFRTLREQVIEDLMCGAAAIEKQPSADPLRPIWLWPVDGLSIQQYPGWSGGKNEARYCQSVGYGSYVGGGPVINLRDDELVYLAPNPSTATPFGYGPLEVAFNSIAAQLGVGEFSRQLTSNARPAVVIDLGKGATSETLSAFRAYWQNDIEGMGKTPIIASDGGDVRRLWPDGDNALFLKYQEFQKAEIATAFDLTPMNLGVEQDLNKSIAEVNAERDRDHAIKPWATMLAAHITRGVIHRGLGFYQLYLHFPGLDPEDEKGEADTYAVEWNANAVTANEYRERRGMSPSPNPFADMFKADIEIAVAAARSAAVVDDPNLKPGQTSPKPKAPK